METSQAPATEQAAALSPNEQQVLNTVVQQLQNGRSTTIVVQNLVAAGMDQKQASELVISINRRLSEAKNKQANRDILFGSLWCVGGLVVTMVTYSAASGGGRYVVAWGAIIFGGIQLFKGLMNRS